MIRTALRFLFLLLLSFVFEGSTFAGLSLSRIAETCGPSIVTIRAFDREDRMMSLGSGFFLNSRGDLATSRHVLAGSYRATVSAPEGREGEIQGIRLADPRLDLVVVRSTLRNTVPLDLGDSDKILEGIPVITIGNAGDTQGALSLGHVTHLRVLGDFRLIQMTAPILPGWSGAPVFSSNGEVIGIVTAFLDLMPDLNFALPVNLLRTLKPTSMELTELTRTTTRLKAALWGDSILEVLMTQDYSPPDLSFKQKRMDIPGQTFNDSSGGAPSGTVYFKNGKTLLCDRAWKQGRTVFLVVHGKGFALGYDQELIDMKRSFDRLL